jgi:hypothetical protein
MLIANEVHSPREGDQLLLLPLTKEAAPMPHQHIIECKLG